MNEATILICLGTVEITENGKKLAGKKGLKISLEAKVKTASNAKLELEINGDTFVVPNDQTLTVKDLLLSNGGNSGITHTAGVRG